MSRPRAVVLLALALCSSVGANVYLLRRGESYYAQLSAVRLDPLGLSAHVNDAPPPVTPPRRRVVFLGDSRAQMWLSPPDTPEWQFVNRGVGNQTSAQVLARFDVEIPPLHPDVLVVEVGVNDLKAIPLFPGRRDEFVGAVEDHVRELVRRSRALGARVILVTVFPIGDVDLAHRLEMEPGTRSRPSVAGVNRFIDTLAGAGVELLHADPVLLDDSGAIRPTYSVDMLHFSPSAYAALDEKLLPMLRQPTPPSPMKMPRVLQVIFFLSLVAERDVTYMNYLPSPGQLIGWFLEPHPLHASVYELLCAGMLLVAWSKARGARVRPMRRALAASLLTVLLWVLYGFLNGGWGKGMYAQIHFWTFAMIFSLAVGNVMTTREDFPRNAEGDRLRRRSTAR